MLGRAIALMRVSGINKNVGDNSHPADWNHKVFYRQSIHW
jgi:hypothetical protein